MNAADAVLDDPINRWVALITAVGAIALAALYLVVKLRKLASDLGLVNHEVKNDHKTNFREEADERHYENTRKLDALLDLTASNTRQIAALNGQVNSLFGRINSIERTQDGRPLE